MKHIRCFASRYAVCRRCAAMLVMILYGTACYTWHTEQAGPQAVVTTRQPEILRVTRTDGSEVVLHQTVLQADTLVGVARDQHGSAEVHVALTDIQQIATFRFSAGRTLGFLVGVAAATAAAIGVAFFVALARCGGCD
jgi:hypothetical protein